MIVLDRPLDGPCHAMDSWRAVSSDYFRVLQIPLVRGRVFTEHDTAESQPVVIVNETLARRFWPTGEPLTARIQLGKGLGREFVEPPRQIVGIVRDVRDAELNREPAPTVYVPLTQLSDARTAWQSRLIPFVWLVRTQADPRAVSSAVQRELQASSGLPVTDLRSMDDIVKQSVVKANFNTLVLTIFGVSALVLAAIGSYGLMAYVVQQRRREIGLRLALGAEPRRIRNSVVWCGSRLVLVGIGIGLILSLSLTRFMTSVLFHVSPLDPLTFTVVPLVLGAIGLLAAWIPARAATLVDPVIALRSE